MQNLIEGFLIGAGLIIAIGAQNAFVLRQGLLRSHVFIIALICSVSDALLFLLGVAGVGILISDNTYLLLVLTIVGATFLIGYGSLAARRAWVGGQTMTMQLAKQKNKQRLKVVVATTLALTYLNPHVYLDTIIIFGSLSAPMLWDAKWQFFVGACLSSFTWFFGLAYGARLLTPIFQKPQVWRILDLIIAMIIYWIATGLILYAVNTINAV